MPNFQGIKKLSFERAVFFNMKLYKNLKLECYRVYYAINEYINANLNPTPYTLHSKL